MRDNDEKGALMPETVRTETERVLLTFCRQQKLFNPGDRVIAACSGGADSMALLLFLLNCKKQLGITLCAAHVNHGLRGADANADAHFVESFCKKNGVPFFLYDASVEQVEVPTAPGEDWARRLRYGWFDKLAAEHQALVATAHTQNDQAETLLLRLTRGTGTHGAAGIAAQRGPYRRPMLCLSRTQTEAYCGVCGQTYVWDKSNESLRYARNQVRLQVLPQLQKLNPSVVEHLVAFCEKMQQTDAFLQQQACQLLTQAKMDGVTTNTIEKAWKLSLLRDAPPPVLEEALRLLVAEARDPQARYIEMLQAFIQRGSGAVQLNETTRYCVCKQNNVLWKETISAHKGNGNQKAWQPVDFVPGDYRLPGGFALHAEVQNYEEFLKSFSIHKKDLNSCADYAKIQKNMKLRTRLPGDRMFLKGRHIHKSLKKLLNEFAVPPARRAQLPLLASGGDVLWLWGCGFSEGLAPNADTVRVLVMTTNEIQEES